MKLLGSAAGGGLPQWNCACANCEKARKGVIPSRSQSSLAFSRDGHAWFLVNASPDIASQIESLPIAAQGARNSRFEGILLTNGDLDHTLGLLIAREGGPVAVYATDEVQKSVGDAFGGLLARHHGPGCPGIVHRALPRGAVELQGADGRPAGLVVRAIPMESAPPRYAGGGEPIIGHACAFVIEETGVGRVISALDVPGPSTELAHEISSADLTLFDGSFWSETEMVELGLSERTAKEMGHWPVGGSNGSLAILGELARGKLVYAHINNSNPMLDPGSLPRKAVELAGATVGEDGMEWMF